MRRHPLPTLAVLASLVVGASGPLPARAQEGARCLEELSDPEVAVRLRRIEAGFASTRTESRMWYWTWLASFAALTSVQLFLVANTKSEPVRDAYIFGAVGSTAATLQLLISPFAPAFAERRLARMPDSTPAERRARLAVAESLLEKSARQERRLRSPYRHLAAFLYPVVTFSYVYGRYHGREVDRFGGMRLLLLGNLIGGFAIPEVQAFTAPQTHIALWEDHQYGSRPCMAPHLSEERSPEVAFAPSPFGGAFVVRF